MKSTARIFLCSNAPTIDSTRDTVLALCVYRYIMLSYERATERIDSG